MILTFPDGPILVDQKPALENLRINLAPNRQLRLKCNAIKENEGPKSMDIVVYEYSLPRLDGATLGIIFEGTEMVNNQPFKLNLSFNFLKRRWRLKGRFNGKDIDESMQHVIEIINAVKALI